MLSSNYALYGDMSRRVIDTHSTFSPEVECYNIDAAYLNLAGFERHSLAEYARQIRATARRHTGIPVSIGIEPTKMLAKIANQMANAQPETGGVYEFAATQSFYANHATVTLSYPTDFTPDLVQAATRLLETLYRPSVHYQKCGVMLLDLPPVTQVQVDFFDPWESESRGQADAHARLAQYRIWHAYRARRQSWWATTRLGDGASIPQPALYDELAGVAGRQVAKRLYDMDQARKCCEERTE